MAETKDGGPAFPHDARDLGERAANGMSLRDYFAGQALVGMLNQARAVESDLIASGARTCYRLADAMLAARSTP